jgi:hypothetical protein
MRGRALDPLLTCSIDTCCMNLAPSHVLICFQDLELHRNKALQNASKSRSDNLGLDLC